jgi:predicted GNAT superfamily acetyltransferase
MSTDERPSGNEPWFAQRGVSHLVEPVDDPSALDTIDVRTISTRAEFDAHDALMQGVWGVTGSLVTIEMLTAIAHSGGYVSAAFRDDQMVGASVGFLADHHGERALHSHITGVVDSMRHAGIGRAIKLHQRRWAADRRLGWITWTFDPLVRRNAWFNIALLGADVDAYLPSFYGTMTDAINAGDESDRLLIAWEVGAAIPERPRDGSDVADALLVPTPADIVELRRSDPAAVAAWRRDTRDTLTAALDRGQRVLGFTREGAYVIGSPS